jgi:gas vesicle protein
MSSGKVLLGVLTGLTAGALIGILFAPKKGSVTRKKIAGKGSDYADAVKEKFNEFLDGITKKYEDVKEAAKESVHEKTAKSKTEEKEAKTAKA